MTASEKSSDHARRTYGDRCGIARALDIVGERWTLLVVRELLLGPKRFTDLRAGLPNVSADVLSQRLRELERAQMVRRATLPPPAGSRVYELTARGAQLEPVILALGRWGSRSPLPDGPAGFGADSAALALKATFSPERADHVDATFELRLGGHIYRVRIARQLMEIGRGSAEHPDAVLETDPATLANLLWHGASLTAVTREGAAAVSGSRQAIRTFLRLFPLASSA